MLALVKDLEGQKGLRPSTSQTTSWARGLFVRIFVADFPLADMRCLDNFPA